MDLAAIHPLLPLWNDLDRVYIRSEYGRMGAESGASLWPWESDNPELRELWERLTRPANLAALEDWARGIDSFSDWARGCTLRALSDCRTRCAGADDPPPADTDRRSSH